MPQQWHDTYRLDEEGRAVVAENLGLVYHVLRKRFRDRQLQDDYYDVAVLGLINAVRTWRPERSRGGTFGTWAFTCIWTSISNARLKESRRQLRWQRMLEKWDRRETNDDEVREAAIREFLHVSRKSLLRMIRPHINHNQYRVLCLHRLAGWQHKRICKLLGISRQRISQIELRALDKLRTALAV